MIGTAAAIIGSAVLGAGATALSASNASHAAQSAADAQSQAAAQNIAEQQREFDTIQANNAPYRQVGTSAISALGAGFGLSGYGTPSMTAPVASTPVANPGGMTGLQDQAIGVPAGTLGTGKTGNGVSIDPASAGPPTMTGGAIDGQSPAVWDAYIAANPDVAAWIQSGHGDPSLGPSQTPEQAAAFQFQNTGQSEGRQLPAVSMTGAPGSSAPPGYNDPTAPNGYTVGARPDAVSIPQGYTPSALDVSLNAYQKSPDFNFRLQQGNQALGHVASLMGGLMSGARLKAADRYNQDYATTDYNNWRDYTTNQFNTTNAFQNQLSQEAIAQANNDRARQDGLYQDDRSYDAGRYDTRNSQLLTLAGFGTQANNADANAAQSFATNAGNQRMTAATAQGNAAISGANAFTSGVNNLMTTGAYLGGQALSNPSSYYGVNPSMTGAVNFSGMNFATPFPGA